MGNSGTGDAAWQGIWLAIPWNGWNQPWVGGQLPWEGVNALSTLLIALIGGFWAVRAKLRESEEQRMAELLKTYEPLWELLHSLKMACRAWMEGYKPTTIGEPDFITERRGTELESEIHQAFHKLESFMAIKERISRVAKKIIGDLQDQFDGARMHDGRPGKGGSRPEPPGPVALYGRIVPEAIEVVRKQMTEDLGPNSPI